MTRSALLRALIGALALVAVLALAAAALAAHPKKGRIFAGLTAHEKVSVILTVSKNGRTVTVSVPDAPLYCQGGGPPTKQVTKPAVISNGGSFSGSIAYQLQGKTAYKVSFGGKFTKPTVAIGNVRSEYQHAPQCSGSTSFTAKPGGAL
jgi:hypothetical protein